MLRAITRSTRLVASPAARYYRSYALGTPSALGVHAPDETLLKNKLPVFRPDEPGLEHVSMGKLREDLHSVARLNLEFIKLDSVVSMSPEELRNVVVVPKKEKVSMELRVERLETELAEAKKMIEALKKK
eukprot:TRINITY_DN1982_c0_g2_i1.p1 TRINITY_DN1982_c0_g2~~TRINITY_DN1982_c0_g2_i1.p1  ORF type:complete len:130 (-),score=51.12 TRINITY_DN1982_c0_g2_i1:34-423(-)